MLELIGKDSNSVTPLILFMCRILGPPLRFKVGMRVKANCGEEGWQSGTVVKLWDEDRKGSRKPYAIRLDKNSNVVMAPRDSEECVVKAEPRFKVQQQVMANRENGY